MQMYIKLARLTKSNYVCSHGVSLGMVDILKVCTHMRSYDTQQLIYLWANISNIIIIHSKYTVYSQ